MSQRCPACQEPMPAGAASCPECGWVSAAAPALAPPAAPGKARPTGVPPRDVRCDVCKAQSRPGSLVCERCSSVLPLAAGTELVGGGSRYRLEKHLKSGGFGAVYKSTRLDDGLTVAVKEMICTNPAERAVRYELFRREARILQEAQAFRVVPLYFDFFAVGQDAYLVLEFVQGEDLLRGMFRNGPTQPPVPYPVDQVVSWAAQVCDVLNWMHTQHPPMVHRDLKPENVMLLPIGAGIKMIDFGTVRAASKTPQGAAPPSQTQFIHTEGYAPLEQIAGKPEPRSDLFALSATIFHLLTGQPPDGHRTPRLDKVLRSGPRWLADLLQINLQEDPRERYVSVADFRTDLLAKKVTTEVSCSRCQKVNPARVPYCKSCGGPLTQSIVKCPRCHGINVGGSRYCIHDGCLL